MSGNNDANLIQKLTQELTKLVEYVERTRTGLENIEDTVMVGSEAVPQASVQINAVTGDLETAANTIMTIVEEVLAEHERNHGLIESLSSWATTLNEKDRAGGEVLIDEIRAINEKTKQQMMNIFSNMSFHDLSGQKLKKVTSSLSVVQLKLHEIATSFGIKDFDEQKAKDIQKRFNGIVNDAMDQDVVDQLLKELGT